MRSALCLLLLLTACDDSAQAPSPDQSSAPRDAAPILPFPRDFSVDQALDLIPLWDTVPQDLSLDQGLQDQAFTGPDLEFADLRPDLPPAQPCPAPREGYLGVRLEDLNGDPLEEGDRLKVTVELLTQERSAEPVWIQLRHFNLSVFPETLEREGLPVEAQLDERLTLSFSLESLEPQLFTYEVKVARHVDLIVALGGLFLQEERCLNPRSRSGTFLQVLAHSGKTPVCVDLAEFRSIQVAPRIQLRNTDAYAQANGYREDLEAGNFIFCPEAPTIVHSSEFCVEAAEGVEVSLAGHYRGDAGWDVDDFVLLETLQDRQLFAEGTTSQHHPGGPNFWCGDGEGQLLCTEGCTATLSAEDGHQIPILEPVAESLSNPPRWQEDGAVQIQHLFPQSGPFQLRTTALDVGAEGTIQPDLYLLIRPSP